MLEANSPDIDRYGSYGGGVALPPRGRRARPSRSIFSEEVQLMTYNRLALSSPVG